MSIKMTIHTTYHSPLYSTRLRMHFTSALTCSASLANTLRPGWSANTFFYLSHILSTKRLCGVEVAEVKISKLLCKCKHPVNRLFTFRDLSAYRMCPLKRSPCAQPILLSIRSSSYWSPSKQIGPSKMFAAKQEYLRPRTTTEKQSAVEIHPMIWNK